MTSPFEEILTFLSHKGGCNDKIPHCMHGGMHGFEKQPSSPLGPLEKGRKADAGRKENGREINFPLRVFLDCSFRRKHIA